MIKIFNSFISPRKKTKKMIIKFSAEILKYGRKGEKTGWTYISLDKDLAEQIKAHNKKSFRVKGKMDACAVKGIAVIPVGGGEFIIALNDVLRTKLRKKEGDVLACQLEEDIEYKVDIPADLHETLREEDCMIENFLKLLPSHRSYYINWINAAKTEMTRAKRLSMTANAMYHGLTYPEMVRLEREEKRFA